ncbi:DUF2391 family protein [Candidatus Woesearchaeota archaeon]|nr:DUF2391 family protein [Candidatus Woesearchaeota archaeon]
MQRKKEEELIQDIRTIKNKLISREPKPFGVKDIIHSIFGSLIFGLTFALKGLLVEVAIMLTTLQQILIVISTLVILTFEIYFIGYKKVRAKEERKFLQFWLKRLVTFYLVAILVSFFIIYIYGIHNLVGNGNNLLKLVVVVSMPSAVGAGLADLAKRYRYG